MEPYALTMKTPYAAVAPAVALLIAASVVPPADAREPMPKGFDPAQHMTVDEVKPGMTGYGLTVYNGTKIETFDVVVTSVEKGFNPGKQLVWVRCTDERMQHLGPVSGMSGSPIFLWDEKTPQADRKPGQGGRMIGAFAYGYGGGKDCYAGIQPIEQMLATGARAGDGTDDASASSAGAADPRQLIAITLAEAERGKVPAEHAWRVRMIADLLGIEAASAAAEPKTSELGRRNTLMLPARVGSTAHADALRPFLQPIGLMPLAGTGASSSPPNWIDRDSVKPERGGVAAVPLMTGDAEFPVVGTITEVLDDGTVLMFGHAMNQDGATRLPFATGYIHFVQPHLGGSFKLGGSLKTSGSLVNDEFAAVVSKPNVKTPYYPSTVRVVWPKYPSKTRTFNYQVVKDDYYAGLLAGYSVGMSVGADTQPPEDSSLRLKTKLKFEGGREITINEVMPMAYSFAPVYSLATPIGALADTTWGKIEFRGAETEVEVVDQVRRAMIEQVILRRTAVLPGETISITLKLRPYKGDPYEKQLELKVPEDAEPGPRRLLIGGASAYANRLQELRPHEWRVENMDQLFDRVRFVTSLRSDAMYAVLSNDQEQQLAMGRDAMPDLPSSRRAMLTGGNHSRVTPWAPSIEQRYDMPDVVSGNLDFAITIKDPAND